MFLSPPGAPGGGGELNEEEQKRRRTGNTYHIQRLPDYYENGDPRYAERSELPLLLSVPELAGVLGISRSGAYELVKERGFPTLKIGSRILVPRDKLVAWIDRKSAGGK